MESMDDVILNLNEKILLKDRVLRLRSNQDYVKVVDEMFTKHMTEMLLARLNEESALLDTKVRDAIVVQLTGISFFKTVIDNIVSDGKDAEVTKNLVYQEFNHNPEE